jgi:hypothetical protein
VTDPAVPRPLWRALLLSLAGWLAFGALLHWHEHLYWQPDAPLWPAIVTETLPDYGPYALLWIALLRAVPRALRVAGVARLVRLLACCVLATVVHLGVRGALRWAQDGAELAERRGLSPGLGALLVDEVGRGFVFQGFLYALLTGAAFGLAQRGAAAPQERQAAALREQLLAAELQLLRSRLQPHFLFNALHAVAVVARRDGAKAERMLVLLGDLLRHSLRQRQQDLVPLRQELDLLQPYLDLQQIRFHDRLTVDVAVPEAVQGAAVPDLLLQPLVENALQHGIERRSGPGTVTVTGRRDGPRLVLLVADDGVGPPPGAGEGIGLGTTRARLRALFGDSASLALRARDGGGAVVEVSLPYRESAGDGR